MSKQAVAAAAAAAAVPVPAAAAAVAVSRVGGEVGREDIKNAIHLFHLNHYALCIVQSTAAAPVRAFCFV